MHARMNNPRQEVIQHNVLVMEADLLLHIGERQIRILRAKSIVKALEQSLQLRNNRSFRRCADRR